MIASKTTRAEIEVLYRQRFRSSLPILLLMKGGMKGHDRMSRDEAWDVCLKAAESGKALEYDMPAGATDLA